MAKARLDLHTRGVKLIASRVTQGIYDRADAIDGINRMVEHLPAADFAEARDITEKFLGQAFDEKGFRPIEWAPEPVVIDAYARNDAERRMEYEANWFAAAFLMPETEFRSAFKKCDGDTAGVARHFGVPVAIAELRAKALGLVKNASHHP